MLRPLVFSAAIAGVLGFVPAAPAQILNTLGGWDDRVPGWSGRVGLTGSLSGGNTDVKSGAGSGRAQWRGETWMFRGLGSFRFEESNGLRAREESVVHARVVRPGESDWQPLAFAQSQRNPFRRLETRILVGAGVQYVFHRSERARLVLGGTPMVEFEKIDGEDETTRGRMSVSAVVTAEAESGASLSLIAFYQPRFSDPADSRASVSGSTTSPLVGPLSLLASASYEHDDDPPEGVKPDDWSAEFGVTLDL